MNNKFPEKPFIYINRLNPNSNFPTTFYQNTSQTDAPTWESPYQGDNPNPASIPTYKLEIGLTLFEPICRGIVTGNEIQPSRCGSLGPITSSYRDAQIRIAQHTGQIPPHLKKINKYVITY